MTPYPSYQGHETISNQLARRGLDVVLISRSLEKLKTVATDIEQEFGCYTKIIQTDFTGGSEIYEPINDALKGLDIGILVNNVGIKVPDHPARFLDVPDISKVIENMANCNMLSVMQMTRLVLPHMLKKKKGVIINLSSEVGKRPYPMTLLYSITKAFVDFFSRGLHLEYKSRGIIVQSVMPLLVSTNLSQNKKPNIFIKTPEAFVCDALNTVAYTQRTSGCLSHSLQSYALDLLLPDILLYTLVSLKSQEDCYKSIDCKKEK
ncbi:hypothetical protein GDO86_006089 [Hymenochirus boettgeri]|uniref:3-ketoacyl-CoA reductase n=1 Tax=Hymenochirus boettgeri TaxID=247094 RepID=A0A8T2J9L4_9PIPI|nr:hypothetical protein GDO86_006089 [Hymenochirus boettgeri]